MICDRIFIGLIFFQLTTAGQLILQKAFARSVMMIPLVIGTIWLSIVYSKTYKPLMKFIALSAVKRGEHYQDHEPSGVTSPDNPVSYAASLSSMNLAPERNIWASGDDAVQQRIPRSHLNDKNAPGMRFINPSLVAPLGGVWIADKNFRSGGDGAGPSAEAVEEGEAELERERTEDENVV